MTNRLLDDLTQWHNATDLAIAKEARDAIDRLTRDLALARAEADRLNTYHETWQRTRTSWEAENERLRAALKPFAHSDFAAHLEDRAESDNQLIWTNAPGQRWCTDITVGDFRRAVETFGASEQEAP